MYDLLSLLSIPVVLALTFAIVRAGNRGHRVAALPVCGCDHNLAWHDPTTNQCHATIRHGRGLLVRVQLTRCECRQYVEADA